MLEHLKMVSVPMATHSDLTAVQPRLTGFGEPMEVGYRS